jgi:hypothetical protein
MSGNVFGHPSKPSDAVAAAVQAAATNHHHRLPPLSHHAASEPAVVASMLTDSLDSPMDVATGEIMEHGGAEGMHPGHARILYVGDHMHGDVVAPVKECEWHAVAVVEEAEVSLPRAHRADICAVVKTQGEEEEEARGDRSELNWSPEYAAACPWGSFWEAGPEQRQHRQQQQHNEEEAELEQQGLERDGKGQRRSWFCALLEAHAAVIVSDVDALVDIPR